MGSKAAVPHRKPPLAFENGVFHIGTLWLSPSRHCSLACRIPWRASAVRDPAFSSSHAIPSGTADLVLPGGSLFCPLRHLIVLAVVEGPS